NSLEDLQLICDRYIENLIKTEPKKKLGDYIEADDNRNKDGKITLFQGVSNNKYFMTPKQVAINIYNTKIVKDGEFAYNKATTRNGEKISIALRKGEACAVLSAYQVFKVINDDLMSEYLLLWFTRSEFDRYARY